MKSKVKKIELYSERCLNLEKNLNLLKNELITWKSKADIINLLEKEVNHLRSDLNDQEKMNNDVHKIVLLKTKDLQEIINKLEMQNNGYNKKIDNLEEENEILRTENISLIQKNNEIIFDNNILKAKIASSEINSEIIKCLTSEKESLVREINGLRSLNQELINKLKSSNIKQV